MKKRIINILFGFGILLTVGLSINFVIPGNRYFEIVKNLDIYASLFKIINEYYVDDVNPSQLMNKSVESMLKDLDPYTVYISEDKIESFRTMNTGQYAGIGASTVNIDGRIFVSMLYKGFSAYENGLRIGDEIIKIDNVPIKGLSRDRLNEMVKGQAKTIINLTVKELHGGNIKEIQFEREKVTIPNVPYAGKLNETIGYIKFTEFTPNGYKNIKKELQRLIKNGAEAVVLDLRGNLGGLLKEAVDICNLFIDSDLEVVHTKGKIESNSFVYKTEYNPLAAEIPLVVLVDNMSASASEIVAGTLQDYDRAVLIGQKTFGKGLVQNTRDLPYNSKVKMTIAKYYIPSGRCIQAVDYSNRNPDGSVGKIPDSLKIAFKTRNGRTVYDGGGIDPEISLKSKRHSELARQLVIEGYIFRFANKYKTGHQEIVDARDFDLTEEEFTEFGEWIEQEGFVYENSLNKELEVLKKEAGAVIANEDFKGSINEIDKLLNGPLRKMLNFNRQEIKELLEQEIASRYYLESGKVEASLGDDKAVQTAIEVLTDQSRYKSLLTGTGN